MEKDSEYLKLVKNPSNKQKIARKAFLLYLKTKGISDIKPTIKLDSNNENYNCFRVQSYSYIEKGEKVYRNIECKNGLMDEYEGINSLADFLENSVKIYPNNKFIGYRPIITASDSADGKSTNFEFGDYIWKTYSESWKNILNLSLIFIDNEINKSNKIAFFLETSITWFTCAFALYKIGSTFITVYSNLSDEAIEYSFNLTKVSSVLVDKKSVVRFISIISKVPTIKKVFCTKDCEPILGSLSNDDIKVINIDNYDLNQDINEDNMDKILKCSPVPSDLAFIMFTSGSTGMPKGVKITHKNVISAISSIKNDSKFFSDRTFICYLPEAHIFELISEFAFILNGGKLGFSHSLCLFDTSPMIKPGTKGDLSALQPDFMIAVPLVLERAKKAIMDKITSLPPIKKIIFETAYNIKLNYFKVGLNTPILDKLIFKKLKTVFGGRLTHLYIGGARPHPNTEAFFNIIFGYFKQAYGLTETCCGGCFSNNDYWPYENVGPVTRCIELKLVPWEEGGYNPNDIEKPRGEIYLRGKCITEGYYENNEANEDSFIFDEETGSRWFKTGDIAEYLSDGTFRIIDRRKDIIKLKHGEYVSLVKVEVICMQSIYVDFICVAPNKDHYYLVGIVVPNRQAVDKLAIANNINTQDFEELIKSEIIKETICNDIKNKISSSDLNKFESLDKIVIVSDLWTPESNLLTPSAKLRRTAINAKYKEHLI